MLDNNYSLDTNNILIGSKTQLDSYSSMLVVGQNTNVFSKPGETKDVNTYIPKYEAM